ncbi:MAG: sigma-70 family RNA polymerase sigma factor [Ferruginibacter sp.]
MTDTQIIEHLKHNKYSLALIGLYEIMPGVKKYILANSGTMDDAQDIFQDALVVLYKKVHSNNFQLTAPLKNYLLAIVKNCWLHELRQRSKIPPGESSGEFAMLEIDDEPGFHLATSAFNLLGEKCKELLIRFYFKKQSFKEIAVSLSFSDEKTAKNQKYRCIQKAKENYLILSNNGTHG